MLNLKEQQIIDFVESVGECSSTEVFEGTSISVSYATLKRDLLKLINENYLVKKDKIFSLSCFYSN
jgi:hypothetical protein